MVQAAALNERVNLFVSGRKLKNLDVFSKSDPRCILFEKKGNQWQKIGQTEIIMNNLNPDFQTSFTVAYFFEKEQSFKFQMIDIDNDAGTEFDIIGEVEVTLGTLMGAARQTWTSNISHNGKPGGQIVVRTQSMAGATNYVARFAPNWTNVNNNAGGCFGMCDSRQDYVMRILREVDVNRFVQCHQVPGRYNAPQARMPHQEISLQ